jgi:hypothetical protein
LDFLGAQPNDRESKRF